MSEYRRLKEQKEMILTVRRERLVNKLLDAAFHELQHDTGETNPEYVYQRNLLKEKFVKILKEAQ